MDRNQLRGRIGDELNVIFAAAGFNLHKLLRAYTLFLRSFFMFTFLHLASQLQKRYSNRFGKERARERKNLPSKGFSLLASGFCIIDLINCSKVHRSTRTHVLYENATENDLEVKRQNLIFRI